MLVFGFVEVYIGLMSNPMRPALQAFVRKVDTFSFWSSVWEGLECEVRVQRRTGLPTSVCLAHRFWQNSARGEEGCRRKVVVRVRRSRTAIGEKLGRAETTTV